MNRETEFARICAEAAACRLCPALAERQALLSPSNGTLQPRVLFVAEAPGRQGGDRTRTPLVGDKSGLNFDRYLASIALPRSEIFITNAALCNPRTPTGANRKPTNAEIANCNDFLRRQIALLNPPVIATLGAVALAALARLAYHNLSLRVSAGQVHQWHGHWLVPLYHPSPQVLASHRREAQQLQDYRALTQALAQIG